ncbi:MAG: TetR/AcrR family transcriptional regulator C-terminal domain-containing protein [Anaerolineaceae bacterium]|nr:TetR/AcrR family transcriptional regulator C-terminal domain-containing protein [Anaerolineaceae bacterium]
MDNNSVDFRVKRTEKMLLNALFILLEKKSINKITINDICVEAMIHRTTFYNHYVDKYDLLESGFQIIFDELTTDINTVQEVITEHTIDNPPPHFVRIFQHIRHKEKLYSSLLEHKSNNLFIPILNDYLSKNIMERLNSHISTPGSSISNSFIAQFCAGAIVNIICWWIDQKFMTPPETMASHLYGLLSTGITPILQNNTN